MIAVYVTSYGRDPDSNDWNSFRLTVEYGLTEQSPSIAKIEVTAVQLLPGPTHLDSVAAELRALATALLEAALSPQSITLRTDGHQP